MERREDQLLREAAMAALDELMDRSAEFPTRSQLRNLSLNVRTPHLIDRQKGIWNPSWLLATLSLVTVLNGRYPDKEIGEGLWEYRYRDGGTEGDNRKLQRAADLDVDLIYFREVAGGRYEPTYPVRVIQNDPVEQKVLIARKDLAKIEWTDDEASITTSLRSWATREVKVRRHQRRFRDDVLDAYSTRCAVCDLPIAALLDAAHIDADSSIEGEPVIANGLALCKLHHYAYDSNILGITPAHKVHLSKRASDYSSTPMVATALLSFEGSRIRLPNAQDFRPAAERLERRWREFRSTVDA